jgi:hypothetical protein
MDKPETPTKEGDPVAKKFEIFEDEIMEIVALTQNYDGTSESALDCFYGIASILQEAVGTEAFTELVKKIKAQHN